MNELFWLPGLASQLADAVFKTKKLENQTKRFHSIVGQMPKVF